jgi:hypothetical protein
MAAPIRIKPGSYSANVGWVPCFFGDRHAGADVTFHVHVNHADLAGLDIGKVREIDRARIDDGPFQHAPRPQDFGGPVAIGADHADFGARLCRAGDRGIDNDIRLRPDAVDNGRVNVGVVVLNARVGIVSVHVDDRCAGLGHGNAIRHDFGDRHGDARLILLRPGTVQGCFQPDFTAHGCAPNVDRL